MSVKKFISGTYRLGEYVLDIDAFEKRYRQAIMDVEEWTSQFPVDVAFGVTNEHQYCMFFQIVGDECKSLFHDMTDIVKTWWNHSKLLEKTTGMVKISKR